MVALDLGTSFCAKVHEDGYWELGGTEIAKRLVVLPLGQLRDSLAFHDDVANR